MATISSANLSTESLSPCSDQVKLAGEQSTSSKEASKKKRKGGQQFVKDPTRGSHPPYDAMVKKTITELKEAEGSSKASIFKYICSRYKVGSDHKKINGSIKRALKHLVCIGDLKQVKGRGASGFFKTGTGGKATLAEKPKPNATKPNTVGDQQKLLNAKNTKKKKGKTRMRLLEENVELLQARITVLENMSGVNQEMQVPICTASSELLVKNKPNESEGPEEAYISILPEKSHKIKKGSSHKKHNQFVSLTMEARSKMIEKFDEAVSKNKEQIIALFPRFQLENVRLFEEYNELRQKLSLDLGNDQIFESTVQKTDALKLLEDILRYTELVLFEVKKDVFVRRSERNYINWAEEQRRQLFVKNQIQLDSPGITKTELLRYFDEIQGNVKEVFFSVLTDRQQEMIEKFAVAKVVATNMAIS